MADSKDSKKGGGISGWLNALMGKPKSAASPDAKPAVDPVVKPVVGMSEPKKSEPLTITDLSKEDSVKEDMLKFKAFIGKYKKEAATKVAPLTDRGALVAGKVIESATAEDKPFYQKIIKAFFVIFFTLIIIYVGATLFNVYRGKTPVVEVSQDPTPTPIPFEPSKPSVYSKDETVLKIEEDVNVLKNELIRVSLRENDLQPPRLDFDVTFK